MSSARSIWTTLFLPCIFWGKNHYEVNFQNMITCTPTGGLQEADLQGHKILETIIQGILCHKEEISFERTQPREMQFWPSYLI